jgi:amino acid transporter
VSGFGAVYGSRGFHLVVMTSGFALAAYTLVVATPARLWNPHSWWQSVAVWFAAAIVAHDLVLFPVYALADRLLWSRRGHRRPRVSARNHFRVPALGSALTLLVFLPGIIEQGAPTYLAATGQTQQPFLGRWLLLTAALFAASAVVYAARLTRAGRASTDQRQPPR